MSTPDLSLAQKIADKTRRMCEDGRFSFDELQLAFRNRGMPIEALRYEFTPSGLHYLLSHFDICDIDVRRWRLELCGTVGRPVSLSLDDLKKITQTTMPVTLECAGNGRAFTHPRAVAQPWIREAVSTALWTGVSLSTVLRSVGVDNATRDVVFWGADHGTERGYEHTFARSVSLDVALNGDLLLAHSMNGAPLEPQHGAPLRLIVPGWYGMASVKWLTKIEAIPTDFDGYQQVRSYYYRKHADDPGIPATLAKVRALMVPPGFPDYLSQTRIVDAGLVKLTGRAWSGGGVPVVRAEVGINGEWRDAALGSQPGPYAWHSWSFAWNAEPGEYKLSCRATNAAGDRQPLEPWWTMGGMGNNGVHTIQVLVRE